MNSPFAILILLSLTLMWAIEPPTPEVYLTQKTAEYLETLGISAHHSVVFIPIMRSAMTIPLYDIQPPFWLFIYNLEIVGGSWDTMDFFAAHETGHTICMEFYNYWRKEHCADLAAAHLIGQDVAVKELKKLGEKIPSVLQELELRWKLLEGKDDDE